MTLIRTRRFPVEEPLLFCRVGWMDRYSGPEAAISGAGSGQDIGNEWEAFNFAPFEGRVYGYCSGSSQTRSIDVSRLGASGNSVSGVTVIWVSTRPRKGRQLVVGWYRHATVHRKRHPSPTGRYCYVTDGQRVEYNVDASEADATLLSPEDRTFPVPRARGFMGQSNVAFLNTAASAPLVAELRRYIDEYERTSEFRSPEEVPVGAYVEGTTRRILVNAVERDPRARRACIAHFGPACVVCGMNFAAHYGPRAAGLIHVHHLAPLASLATAREVDPIRDLRPVCPNCHAVIHRQDPPYTPEEVAHMLRNTEDAG